ncbi:TRAP transporter small permease [Dinoroseobacter sp. S375]|uniref:TRAP transporter small permease n=1 Tax=Dinoroseobacter sp. S375 TaxID=3415136 RepID=UPI003C7B5C58
MSPLPAPLGTVERGLHWIAGLFALAGGLALAVLGAVTGVSVFWRYVLRDPIFGIEDISTMALTVVVAGAVAYGAVHQSHVSVNVIKYAGGRGLTRVTDVAARLGGIAICSFAAYGLVTKGSCGMPCGAMTSNLGIIHTPFYYGLAAAMGFYAALLVLHLIIGLLHWSGTDPNEMLD